MAAFTGSNQVVRGDHHQILGSGCTVYGNHNTVMGSGCVVHGNHNTVMGSGCVVHGHHNRVYGAGCRVHGNHNIAFNQSTRLTGDHNSYAGGDPLRAKGSGIGATRTVSSRVVGNPAQAALAAVASGRNPATAALRAVGTSIGVIGNVSGSGIAISGAEPIGRRRAGIFSPSAAGDRLGMQVGSVVNIGSGSYTLSGGVAAGTTVTLVFAGNRRLDVKFESPLARFMQAADSTRAEWLTHDMRATRTSLRVDGREIPLHRVFSRTIAAAAQPPEKVRMSDAALLELAKPEEEVEAKDELLGEDEVVPEDDEGGACAICLERRPKVLARPCNHLVLCLHCARGLRDRTCSICRQPIKTLIAVFK